MFSGSLTGCSNSIFIIMSEQWPRIVFCCQWQWTGHVAQLFQGRIHRVGNSGAHGEQMQGEAALFCNKDACRELAELWKRCGLEEGQSALLCTPFFSKSELTHNALEPATEALRATLDLLSQTKMGQLFKLLDLLIRLQVWKCFLFFLFSFIFFFLANVLSGCKTQKIALRSLRIVTFWIKTALLGWYLN